MLGPIYTSQRPNQQFPFPGTVLYGDALKKWRRYLGQLEQATSAATSGNGVDIVCVGDSTMTTCESYNLLDIWPHILKRKLQERFNPPNVPGGYGFMPVLDDGKTVYAAGLSGSTAGSWTANALTDSAEGIARRNYTASANPSSIWWLFDNSSTSKIARGFPPMRMASHSSGVPTFDSVFTSVQAVFGKLSSSGSATNKLYFSAFSSNTPPYNPATDAGSGGGVPAGDRTTYSCDGSGTASVGNKSSIITPATQFYLQFSQGAAGSMPLEGCILYNGDTSCGVRLHNIAHGGAVVTDFYGADTSTAGGRAIAGAASAFGTASGTGCNYARLVIIAFGVNECGTSASPTVDAATFQTNLAAMVAKYQSWTSSPDIVLYIHPARNSANTLANWPAFQAAIHNVAKQYGCAVCDTWAALGSSSWTTSVSTYGLGKVDGVHWSDVGNKWVAEQMFRLLTA